MAAARPAPTLFCTSVSNWQYIIVVDPEDKASWWASQILARLGPGSDLAVRNWMPPQNKGRPSHSPDLHEWQPQSTASSLDRMDPTVMPADQQASACLVVPAKALRAILRFRTTRRVLRRWQGSCLVLP